MSGVVKSLIKSSAKVSGLEIPKRDVICLGTPLQVRMLVTTSAAVSYDECTDYCAKEILF